MDLDRPELAARGDFIADNVLLGVLLLAAFLGMQALDRKGLRLANLERPEQGIEVVAGHVADRARAESFPVPPTKGMEAVMVFAIRRRADPLVPVKSRRHGLRGGPAALAAKVAPQEGVGLGHVPDGPVPDILAGLADRVTAMPLVAHLR